MRLDRLLGITLELMAPKRVTASELAAKFEISIRTVYRRLPNGRLSINGSLYPDGNGGVQDGVSY